MNYVLYIKNNCLSCEKLIIHIKENQISCEVVNIQDKKDKRTVIVPALFRDNSLLAYGME